MPTVNAKITELVIDGVDDEGRGRGGKDGWDFAVRGAFPGDSVDAVVEHVWPQLQLAQARRVGELAGALHVERLCGHHGPCAACPLHGVDADFVRAFKQERVRQAFVDGGAADLVSLVGEVIDGDGERQKTKWIVSGHAGAVRLSHYVPHSHQLAPALLCGVTRDALVDVGEALCEALDERGIGPAGGAAKDGVYARAVIAREFVEGVGVVIVGSEKPARGLRVPGVIGVAWRFDDQATNSLVGGRIVDVDGALLGTPLDGGPRCAVDAFCQADLGGAARLVERAAAFVAADAGLCFDLYAGTGAFARALRQKGVAHVVAVEVSAVSVRALAAIDGVTAIEGRVDAVLDRLRGHGPPAGLVVDPPRQGLRTEAAAVAALGARRVALVSCDVDNGARDVAVFVAAGYRVREILPVDLFPGSAEVEVLTLLER